MNGIDVSPLVPLANLAITTFASVATAAIPVVGFYAIQWLRAHAAQAKQQTANAAVQQADGVIQKGIAYAVQQGVDAVPGATAYALAQAPDLFKRLGFDPATDEGKAGVTRMVTARLVPTPVPATPVDLKVEAAPLANTKTKA